MQVVTSTLTVIRGKLHPGERAGAIRSTGPGSEPVCHICDDTGWRRAEGEKFTGLRRCECLSGKIQAARLSVIPERFKNCTFESYCPKNQRQEQALLLMQNDPGGSWFITGAYGNGKTHLFYAQYREVVLAGGIRCHVRTTRELVEELRRAEFDEDYISPVIAAAGKPERYHLFWDDIDKLKPTDFKTEVLFNLVDSLYRQKHGLTVTGNYSMRDLVEHERMHPAIVRRLDDMCRLVEV